MTRGGEARRLATLVLALVGGAILAHVITSIGCSRLAGTLSGAAPIVAALVLLELLALLADTAGARTLQGGTRASSLREGAIAYLVAQLAPGAHGSGEVARALQAAPRLGPARAGRTALALHGAHLVGVTVAALSALACLEGGGTLAVALVGVASWSAALALLVLVGLVVSPRALAWLSDRVGLPRSDEAGLSRATADGAAPDARAHAIAFGWVLAARLVHVAQAWLALALVTGAPSLSRAAAVEALQLVAGAAGDAVPAQVGVVEATFESFAQHVSADVTLAVGVALCLRLARVLTVTTLALAVAAHGRAKAHASVPALLVLLALVPARARADEVGSPPTHQRIDVVLRQRAVVALAPLGLEHLLSVGVRLRWDDGRDPWLAGTHLELGAIAQSSPVDAIVGAYTSFSPWAFLTLRAEVTSISAWAIGELGEGFIPLETQGSPVDGRGDGATGLRVRGEATLAFAIDLGPVRPILHAQLGAELEDLGAQPFHWSARHDRVLARRAWMFTSLVHLLAEVHLAPRLELRLGAFDDVRAAPGGPTSHVLGPAAMVVIGLDDPVIDEVAVLARAGVHLDDTTRNEEWTSLLALFATYTP